MQKIVVIFLTITLLSACITTQKGANKNSDLTEFTVYEIRNETDGQTVFLEDNNGKKFITVISPANGNFVDLQVGNRIALIAEETLKSDPAQIISSKIKVLQADAFNNHMETHIAVDNDIFKKGEPIELYFCVKNSGVRSYTFLPWGTPLENMFTRDCLTISKDQKEIAYSGIMVKRMAPTEKDYLTLDQGQSATGKVNVLTGYNLTETGIYTIQFKEKFKGLPASNIIKIEVVQERN